MTPTFRVALAGTPEHDAATDMVREQYQHHFGSSMVHPLSHSLNLYADSDLAGCIGFSPAAHSDLFLEQYLDAPVEATVAEKLLQKTDREEIVEIGAFAVSQRHHALPLMMAMAPTLLARGFRTAVCTATGPVAGCLRKLGIESVLLAKADASRVKNPADWGRYYALDPVVLAGDIAAGVQSISRFHASLGVDAVQQ